MIDDDDVYDHWVNIMGTLVEMGPPRPNYLEDLIRMNRFGSIYHLGWELGQWISIFNPIYLDLD